MKTYQLTAEHTSGQSVSHPCRSGVYDDPVNTFDEIVEAESAEEAERIGLTRLMVAAQEASPCDCARQLQPGSDSWANSVIVTAMDVRPC